jgi:hypothetical protein
MKKTIFFKAVMALFFFCGTTFIAQTGAGMNDKQLAVSKTQKPPTEIVHNQETGILSISGIASNNHCVKGEIYDISGELILKEEISLENGNGQVKLNAENGIYTLYLYNIIGKTEIHVFKI